MSSSGKKLERVSTSQRSTQEPAFVKWLLVAIAMAFSIVFLFLPIINVFVQAFSKGWSHYLGALSDPDTLSAIRLTLLTAAISVPLNVVFGVAASWAIAKFEFRGKSILLTFIDLPFSISPVVSGLMLILLFGANGLFEPFLRAHEIKIIFAIPGIVLATIFVTFPFVARELIPVMQSTGSEQEQVAMTLGASGWKTFWHITLPSVKWGLLYGVILCNARAMGEFGAVLVVSSRIAGESDTLPLRIEKLYNEFDPAAPFAVASLLALLAVLTLAIKTFLVWRTERRESQAQQSISQTHRPNLK